MSRASASTISPRKRGRGRPVAGSNDVGRERLLIVAEQLLHMLPPAKISMARVAQAANVDPALMRYYFGNRVALLIAVADRATAHSRRGTRPRGAPIAALANHIAQTVSFNYATPFMHRLMIDELVQSGTERSRGPVREMNIDLVAFYREVLSYDGGRELIAVDPLFLHIAVLGASNFFSSAGPMIRELAPAGTDMDRLAVEFQVFLVKLVLDGLRQRQTANADPCRDA